MLHRSTLLRREGIEVADVACRHPRGRGKPEEPLGRHAVVFVRRGCFVRTVRGVETTLDPTLAYCMVPHEEQRYDHPLEHGDDCTAILLSDECVESLQGGERSLPRRPIAASPALDLQHRLLLTRARRMADPHALVEHVLRLLASTLAADDPAPVESGRPSTLAARRTIVSGVRELLAEAPERSLSDLAHALTVSPHHLSRSFRQATGHTISRHRIRLRVRAALDRLAAGDHDLARIASELGFTDQSHLTHCIRTETGTTPAALRHALAVPPAPLRR